MAILNADDGLWKWAQTSSSNSVERTQLSHYNHNFSIKESGGNTLSVMTSFGSSRNRNKKLHLDIDWNFFENSTADPNLEKLTSHTLPIEPGTQVVDLNTLYKSAFNDDKLGNLLFQNHGRLYISASL